MSHPLSISVYLSEWLETGCPSSPAVVNCSFLVPIFPWRAWWHSWSGKERTMVGKKYAIHRLNCHAELLFFFFLGLTDHLIFFLCNSFFSVLGLASFCVLSCLSKRLSLFLCPWLFSCSAPSSRFCPAEDVSSRSSCQLCGLGSGAPRFQDKASTLSTLAVAWSQLYTTVGREGLSGVCLWTGWMLSSLKSVPLLLGSTPIGFCGCFTDLPEN